MLGLVGGQDQTQVIDTARGCRQAGRSYDRRGNLVVNVATEHERQRLAHGSTLPVHVEATEVLRVEAEFHLAQRQCVIDLIAIASQRD